MFRCRCVLHVSVKWFICLVFLYILHLDFIGISPLEFDLCFPLSQLYLIQFWIFFRSLFRGGDCFQALWLFQLLLLLFLVFGTENKPFLIYQFSLEDGCIIWHHCKNICNSAALYPVICVTIWWFCSRGALDIRSFGLTVIERPSFNSAIVVVGWPGAKHFGLIQFQCTIVVFLVKLKYFHYVLDVYAGRPKLCL